MTAGKCNDVYLLEDSNGAVWGIYTDRDLLYGMYENLQAANPELLMKVSQIRVNTNIKVAEWTGAENISGAHHPCRKDPAWSGNTAVVPKELRLEFGRLQTRLKEFKDGFAAFKRMLEEGVLRLDSSPDTIPALLKKKYPIYRDIVSFNVPDDEAFGYFVDRYYYANS